MINWWRGLFCKSKIGHIPVVRFRGICVLGLKCKVCGCEWYEKRGVHLVSNNEKE